MALQVAGIGVFCLFARKSWVFLRRDAWYLAAFLFMIATLCFGYLLNRQSAMLIYILYLLFFMVALDKNTWHYSLCRGLLGMGIVFALGTFLTIAAGEDIYISRIASLYPASEKLLIGMYRQGTYPGIVNHYSTNGMVLVNGLLVLAALLLCSVSKGSAASKRRRKYYLAITVLFLAALVVCGKRAHLLFGCGAILFAYFIYSRSEKKRAFKWIVRVFALLCAVWLAYMFVPQVNAVVSRFANIGEDESVLFRYRLWDSAISMFKENPVFGAGWWTFYNKSISFDYTNRNYHAHNVFLQLLAEGGIVGFLFYTCWFGIMLYKQWKIVSVIAKHRTELTEEVQVVNLFSLMYQVYFVIYCITGNPLYDRNVYPVYFAACCITIYYSCRKDNVRSGV